MKYEPFIVCYTVNGTSYCDYGHDGETPQECAKRIAFEKTGNRPEFVRSLGLGDRVPVSTVDSSVSAKWPKGAITIPKYLFTSLN